MLNKLKKIILVSRPISWLNTAFPFAAGYIVGGGSIDIRFVIGTLYFLIPYNLLMYGINDIFDYESDIRNPRKGGIEGMKEERKLHPLIWRVALISNVPFLAFLFAVGDAVSNTTLAALIFFVVAYSIAKLRFKEKPLLDSITSSIHFVGPLIFALTLTVFTMDALPYVIAFFLWGVASHALGAVQDIIPDRQGKLASIATFFGARLTTWFAFILYFVAAEIVASQVFPYSIIGVVGFLYALNILPHLFITDKTSAEANKPWKRFIWLNLIVGFIVTLVLLYQLFR
jgi:4-hydroxybenzoate polyprenyltransferase